MTLSILPLIAVVLLSIVVGWFACHLFFIKVVIPKAAEELRKENMPKRYAISALNHYHDLLDRVCNNLPPGLPRTTTQESNNRMLETLTRYVENPTSFIEEKQDGQKTI